MSATTATVTAALGYAPDSAYASWCEEGRAAADRVEADANMRHSRNLAIRAANQGHPLWEFGDDSLRRFAKRYARMVEDHEDGTQPLAEGHLRLTKIRLLDVEREQDYRAALAEAWLATDDGTHSYSSFQARGGLEAVLHHGATPPSYELATALDWENWKRGLPHVLDWDAA